MFRTLKNDKVVSIYEPVEFPVEDHEEIALELDVVNLAKQQARKSRPGLEDLEIDVNEHNFRSSFKVKSTQATHRVDQSISSLRNEISALSISKEITDASQMGNEFNKRISTEFTPILNELETLKRECLQSEDDLNSFKREQGLRRSANYPHSHWLTVGILLIALIAESVLNGTFFAEGSDTGLIGGVAIALVIALVNIGGGFLIGWWVLRYKNHCRKWLAITMTGLFCLLLFIPFLFNLIVAHYRGALIVDPDNAPQVAVDNFLNGILSIADVNSWLLFAVGILFCALAIYKGYGVDDPYPGYGKVSRKKETLEEELKDERDDAFGHLEERHQEFLETLESHYEDIERKSKTISNLSTSFDYQKRLLNSYVQHLEDALHYIIKLYRDTNISEREDGIPESFTRPFDTDLGFEGLNIQYQDKQEEINTGKEHLAKALPDIRKLLLDSKDEYHKRIDGVCQL